MLVRALLVLLLLLNVGAATWWIAHDPAAPASPPALPPGVARLQLVSERATPPPARATPAPAPATTTAQAPTATAQCFSLGPFATPAAAQAALARVQPLVDAVAVRAPATQASPRGWRVFLPPLPSREEAQAVAARITAAGFNDLMVVADGAEANSVALGRYRSEEGARSRAAALTAAGFAAQVQPLDEQANAPVWLEARAPAGFDPRRAQTAAAVAQQRPLDCAALR